MGRPREFLEEDALESSMQLFWTGGYHATSTREIVRALDIGRQSVYNAFGDKEDLYHRCILRYQETVLKQRRNDIFSSGAGRREIVKYLAAVVEFLDGDPQHRGCFLFNSLAELSGSDPFVLSEGQAYLEQTKKCLEQAIRTGLKRREISQCADPGAVAASIMATEIGMSLASKTRMDRSTLVDMASTALQPLY